MMENTDDSPIRDDDWEDLNDPSNTDNSDMAEDTADRSIEDAMGEEEEDSLSGFLADNVEIDLEPEDNENEEPPVSQTEERPVTKNLLGDNPPGSEQAAFDAGYNGDMSRDIATYQDTDIIENFRENLDKTEKEIELDKKLKNKGNS